MYDIPFDKTIQNVVTLQAHASSYVDTEKEKKLAFFIRQLELLLQKQSSMNHYCFALQSYPKCNYEQLRDFLVLSCKRKLQYITSSIDKDQTVEGQFKLRSLQLCGAGAPPSHQSVLSSARVCRVSPAGRLPGWRLPLLSLHALSMLWSPSIALFRDESKMLELSLGAAALVMASVQGSQCQFPGDIQGDWATQAITDRLDPLTTESLKPLGVTYSRVTIAHTSVSGWGNCVHRHKRHYVLAQGSGSGGPLCHRCFHLLVVSPNVVVVTSKRGGTCYPSVERARASCPEVLNHQHHEYLKDEDNALYNTRRHETQLSDTELRAQLEAIRKQNELQMLYKVKSSWGDESIAEVECPTLDAKWISTK
ncbi:hypothetical protein FHG87_019345 [Trinorchestia longiramus]|nr:hypothetical protein FHG87_019345 [Trinorchestia longiramus]